MLGRIRNHRSSLFICVLTLVFTVLITSIYSGNKEGCNNIFIMIAMITPILIIALSKNSIFTDIGFSLFIISIILLYAIVFWWYMDRPPSNITDITKAPEELRGGWFSFENPLRIELLVVCSITSLTITSIIKFLVNRRRFFS